MKFEVGDTVRLLHSGEEGEVIEILGKEMVKVKVGKTDFPVFEDQLEHPYYNRFVEMRKAKKKKAKIKGEDIPKEAPKPVERPETGLHFLLLPVFHKGAEGISHFKLYYANETLQKFRIHSREFLNHDLFFQLESEIRPFSRLYLIDFPFDNLNDHPRFDFEVKPVERKEKMQDIFQYTLKLKAKQVIKKIESVESGEKAMFKYTLFEKYPLEEEKVLEDWQFISPKQKIDYRYQSGKSAVSEPIYEIDLHAEKLTNNFRNMTAADILMLQLNTFKNALDRAIGNRQLSMIVIHGIGKGVLKKEVHAILKQTPEVERFVNQHDFRYGFGATEIFFSYN